ncbi:MAG TPA: long-chain fatty acid--CoA ligase [Candidatus Dormibacteraeota bacterium]|jgi:fatty-acyl-CoA synthase|nr:long-chain fatty acid--CoA ligase [Candidatus Dormibacteraeota bacterium]
MPDFPLTLQHFLWRATTLFPGKEIVTRRETGRHRYTYADFGRRVAQLAHALRELGIGPGDRVGTLAWNNYRHLELYFAVPCSGAVLHTLNPRLFPEHLEFVINDADDKVIFVDASIVPALQRVAKNLKGVKQFIVMADGPSPDGQLTPVASYEELIGGRPAVYDWPLLDERDAAAMCYTSGTTGKPKGVVYSHRSSVLHSFGIAIGGGIGLAESDSILPVVPMFHANAWGLAYAATMLGAKLVFPDRFLDPVSLTELFREEKVTFSSGVPSVWIALLQHLDKTGTNLDGLRMFVGGSALPAGLYDGLTRHGIDTNQGWGMTETSPVAAVATMKSYMPESDRRHVRLKAGLPIAGVELRLANVETGQPVPWDGKSVGEIQVRGPWVTSSYYGGVDPERFTADGWLRTGDVANVDPEGYAQIVDRTKDLVKSGGEWISSVELESAIMGHPKVLEAAVIGVPHPKWQERPVAYVVAKPEFKGQVTQQEIIEYLTPLVAKWWLPDEVRFTDEIPKTSVGKFDKKVIREQAIKAPTTTRPSE